MDDPHKKQGGNIGVLRCAGKLACRPEANDFVEGHDASSKRDRSIPLEKAMDDCLVAFYANGEALRMEHGYPVRLIVPWLGRKQCGSSGCAALASTIRLSKPAKKPANTPTCWPMARPEKWTMGEMDAKSVVTSPSPQTPASHGPGSDGYLPVWHGPAEARSPVSMCPRMVAPTGSRPGSRATHSRWHLTRFYVDHVWDGKPMLLQSRAVDETGYVQPTKDQLRAVRGLQSVYHKQRHPDLVCQREWGS